MQTLLETINKLQSSCGQTVFIAIDGHGASGKSTFAKKLGKLLDAPIIETDDFAGIENPKNWYIPLIAKVFGPIAKGAKTLQIQPAIWWEDEKLKPVKNINVKPIMILEGVASCRKEFEPYLAYKIFVDTKAEVCIARGVKRDQDFTGKDPLELRPIWENWRQEELDFYAVDDSKAKADLILDGTHKDFICKGDNYLPYSK